MQTVSLFSMLSRERAWWTEEIFFRHAAPWKKPFWKLLAGVEAHRFREAFAGVAAFVFFVGYPRSGHSLIGALLDAHPNAVVAHELHALDVMRAGFSRQELFGLIMANSRRQARRGRAHDYSYAVPRTLQGDFSTPLSVIGDKCGGASALLLSGQPEFLDTFRSFLHPVHLRALHVVRNPFDSIASIAALERMKLSDAANKFFTCAAGVAAAKPYILPGELLEVHFEEFLRHPDRGIAELCDFLGLSCPAAYRDACVKFAWPLAREPRRAAEWPQGLQAEIAARMQQFPWLHKYQF